ncbi:MAG: hypothetical protein LBR11_02455 [Deltaproteobacteria bacterium]|jgi:tetratricopeptide (TPR) repeat protein|nr:hypothetical protein [Deltaproteobacteria bacterium]
MGRFFTTRERGRPGALGLWLTLSLSLSLSLVGCAKLPLLTIIKDPLDPTEHLQLGQAYEKKGELELAEREYRLALPAAQAYLALGNLYFNRGPTERANQRAAEGFYRQALILGPAPEAANNLAWLYLEEGRLFQTAERLAQRALREGRAAKLGEKVIQNFEDTLRRAQRALREEAQSPRPWYWRFYGGNRPRRKAPAKEESPGGGSLDPGSGPS